MLHKLYLGKQIISHIYLITKFYFLTSENVASLKNEASKNWVKTQNCSSPRKSLVKGERFIRSEEKPEYAFVVPLGTSQSKLTLCTLMVAPLPRGFGTLSGFCKDRRFLTGIVPSNSGKPPRGAGIQAREIVFSWCTVGMQIAGGSAAGDTAHRPGRAALWAPRDCSSLSSLRVRWETDASLPRLRLKPCHFILADPCRHHPFGRKWHPTYLEG